MTSNSALLILKSCWNAMLQRCNNPNNPAYRCYGGRGITVCTRWHKFENFAEDMGERPEGLSIERKNNNKGYSPDNCCWATREEQSKNRRPRKRIKKANNKTLQITLSDETYKSLETLCNQEKIRPATMVVAIIRKALENPK